MIEEKLHKELDWLEIKHIDADGIIRNILAICQQEIDEACKKARLEEHKETVLYWETLPPNELYGIDYHFNRIRELSPKESE